MLLRQTNIENGNKSGFQPNNAVVCHAHQRQNNKFKDVCVLFRLGCKSSVVTLPPRPRDYRRQMVDGLLQVFNARGYLHLPMQSRSSQTSSVATRQNQANWPPEEHQHICWLASLISCESDTDVDEQGWNIYHYLFHSVSSSLLSAKIAANLADKSFPKLQGNMRHAMGQKTQGSTPRY